MKQLIPGFLFLCLLVTGISTSQAQDMKAKKMEGHTWHQVVMVKFKAGKFTEAKKMINDHFMKAGIASGGEGPQIIEFKSGEWDVMFIWNMENISDMDWEITPDDEKWWAAMAEQEGGMDKAMGVMQKYLSLVDQSTSYLAISRQPEMEDLSLNNSQ